MSATSETTTMTAEEKKAKAKLAKETNEKKINEAIKKYVDAKIVKSSDLNGKKFHESVAKDVIQYIINYVKDTQANSKAEHHPFPADKYNLGTEKKSKSSKPTKKKPIKSINDDDEDEKESPKEEETEPEKESEKESDKKSDDKPLNTVASFNGNAKTLLGFVANRLITELSICAKGVKFDDEKSYIEYVMTQSNFKKFDNMTMVNIIIPAVIRNKGVVPNAPQDKKFMKTIMEKAGLNDSGNDYTEYTIKYLVEFFKLLAGVLARMLYSNPKARMTDKDVLGAIRVVSMSNRVVLKEHSNDFSEEQFNTLLFTATQYAHDLNPVSDKPKKAPKPKDEKSKDAKSKDEKVKDEKSKDVKAKTEDKAKPAKASKKEAEYEEDDAEETEESEEEEEEKPKKTKPTKKITQ